MIPLKTLHSKNISSALQLAQKYRLLNEPDEAASICLDILEIEPDHQETLITLLLALTDKFTGAITPYFDQAIALVERLNLPYCRSYYLGIIFERRAKHYIRKGGPGWGLATHEWLRRALKAYAEALEQCDPDNQDAVLRWNSCARIINDNEEIRAEEQGAPEMFLDSFDEPH